MTVLYNPVLYTVLLYTVLVYSYYGSPYVNILAYHIKITVYYPSQKKSVAEFTER